MYNVTVAGAHTYFVGDGLWLVHNSCNPSRTLARNMEKNGINRPPNTATHHIVAHSDPSAASARAILAKEGIGINDAINGVFLDVNSHYS